MCNYEGLVNVSVPAESAPSGETIDGQQFREVAAAWFGALTHYEDDENAIVRAAWKNLCDFIDARRATAGTTAPEIAEKASCPECKGTGYGVVNAYPEAGGCSDCNGKGYVWDVAGTTAGNAAPTVLTIPKAIMDLRCDVNNCIVGGAAADIAYKMGHRDARHAAADLVLERADELAALASPAAPAAPGDLPPPSGERNSALRAEPAVIDWPPLPAPETKVTTVAGIRFSSTGFSDKHMQEYGQACVDAAT